MGINTEWLRPGRLRTAKGEQTQAKKLSRPVFGAKYDLVPSSKLAKDDIFPVEANDIIPVDGEVIEGVASVNESAVTGESAPHFSGIL